MDELLNSIQQFGKNDMDNLYETLGCTINSSPEQINAEFKARAMLFHPDKLSGNVHNPKILHIAEKFKKINEAHAILSNEESRKLYDNWKSSGIRIPFTSWCKLLENKSFHWLSSKDTTLKISTSGQDQKASRKLENPKSANIPRSSAEQENDDLYTKFRNYEV